MSFFVTDANRVSTSALRLSNDEYLQHGLFNWGKHKYIKRTGTPGHYVYTYAENVRNAGRNLVSKATTFGRSASQRGRATIHNVGQTVSNAIGFAQRKNYNSANRERNRSYIQGLSGGFSSNSYVDRHRSLERKAQESLASYIRTPLGKMIGGRAARAESDHAYNVYANAVQNGDTPEHIKQAYINYKQAHSIYSQTLLARVSNVVDAGHEFFSNLPASLLNTRMTQVSSNFTIPETILNETIIPETIIPETIIPERKH